MIQAISRFSATGKRPVNEDCLLVNRERRIFVVADGFGGPGPGVSASQRACEGVLEFLSREAGDGEATLPFVLRSYFSLAGNVLFNALVHANRGVLKLNEGRPLQQRGGASVIAGYMDGNLLALASIGGCSAWLLRDGQSAELVTPRTWARLNDPFSPDPAPEEAIPLSAIGLAEDIEPEIVEYRIRPGDALFLHTDGVGEKVREKIQGALLQEESLKKILENQEFEDNATALLVLF